MNKAKRRPMPPRTTHRPSRSRRTISNAPQESISMSALLPLLCRGVGISALVSLVLGGALMLIAALILCFVPDPDGCMSGVSLAILFLCAIASGFATAHTVRAKALICGLCSGTILLILMFLLSFLAAGTGSVFAGGMAAGLRIAVFPFAILGALMGMNAPRKR